ncbi:MAG: UDP-N-acetylglucosamine--N-acetylmuramyl-(pentapeptide) pyrophosphoryl-undecaprenol N-acetylglucosamine transferase, partial [bacterium]
ARRILTDWRPAAVAGMGSYISFPAVLAARISGVPSFIHEANAVFGLSNRICSFFASGVALGLPMHGITGGSRFRITGMPVRSHFSGPESPITARAAFGLAPEKTTVLIFGGSQGARKLNLVMSDLAKRLVAERPDIQFLHISGHRDHEMMKAAYQGTAQTGCIALLDYCDDMHKAYAAADMVVSRAGAGTVAELIQLRKPAILVPLPDAPDDHQAENAGILESAGAAIMLRESPLFREELYARIAALLSTPERLSAMRKGFAQLKLPEPAVAAAKLAEFIIETLQKA